MQHKFKQYYEHKEIKEKRKRVEGRKKMREGRNKGPGKGEGRIDRKEKRGSAKISHCF